MRAPTLANTRSWLGGTHDLKGGVQTTYGTQRTVGIRIGNVSYTDLGGAPYRATFSEPSATGGRIRTLGLYVQDTWTVNDALTLNLGVRFDNVRGDVPELTSEATLDGINGASFSPPVVSYPGISDLISFNTFAPRAGFTYRLNRSGRTVLKSGYGRFYGKLASLMFSGISPGGAVTYVREINPATGQYDIPVSVTDPKLNFSVDGGLDNQYTDQFSVGVEQQVGTFALADLAGKKHRDVCLRQAKVSPRLVAQRHTRGFVAGKRSCLDAVGREHQFRVRHIQSLIVAQRPLADIKHPREPTIQRFVHCRTR